MERLICIHIHNLVKMVRIAILSLVMKIFSAVNSFHITDLNRVVSVSYGEMMCTVYWAMA